MDFLRSSSNSANIPVYSLSNGTKKILKKLMVRNNLPLRLQRELLDHNANKKYVPRYSEVADVRQNEPKVVRHFLSSKPTLRTKQIIEQYGLYEREKFRPSFRLSSQKEKEKLQNIMAFGKEVDPYESAAREHLGISIDDEINTESKFLEILKEIEEREEFLKDMTELGLQKKYEAQIEFEIKKRMKELEELNINRTESSSREKKDDQTL